MFQVIQSSQLKWFLYLPTIGYALSIFLLYFTDLDYQISLYLFDLQGGQWKLKNNFFTQTIIHQYGKYFSIALYSLIVLCYLFSISGLARAESFKGYKTGLLYLSVSTLIATLGISALKSITSIDCPWSIQGLGGNINYYHWQDVLFVNHNGGRCFPAGHASAAYAFFSLFFFSRYYFAQFSGRVLWMVLVSGIIFGIAQQLRGAHFISHDLTTMYLCWLINLLFYYIFLEKARTENTQVLDVSSET